MPTFSIKEKIGIGILSINHIIGLVGLNSIYSDYFAVLTSINLFFTLLVILFFHKKFDRRFFVLAIGAFLLGMVVEIVGVKTGWLFGEYFYTKLLGPAILGVPIIIGLNWFLLVYIIVNSMNHLAINYIVKVVLSAVIMVGLDYLIEPFAVNYNLWVWQNPTGMPTFQNYVAWFLISALLFGLFYRYGKFENNKVASATFIILTLFFLLNIFIPILLF